MKAFETKVFGKWILAGEHAVLRGSPALVFPLRSRSLQLRFEPDVTLNSLELLLSGEHGDEYALLFWGVMDRAFAMKKMNRSDWKGRVHLQCEIPIGGGLGASAALCSAVTRWLMHEEVVHENESLEFARQLENLFHGESSGVDVAVALSGQAVKYTRGFTPQKLDIHFEPCLCISYSGVRGVTADCVKKVKELLQKDPEKGLAIDLRMKESSLACEAILTSEWGSHSEERLINAINKARDCFQEWGLIEGELAEHMRLLKEKGALAVKPTGSGQGGYVLSLWPEEIINKGPDQSLKKILIPCF